ELSERFGDVYSLTLGTRRCLVVSSLDKIREVLNEKGKFFGGRPDFIRYHKLFGGDRNNSLALCDWSSLQQKRRNIARRHCSPRSSSLFFTKMSDVACSEIDTFFKTLNEKLFPGEEHDIKLIIQEASANMFLQYMCSVRFDYNDQEFQTFVNSFDQIFWEINQGYAVDFLPWLAPLYKKHTDTIIDWSTTIRKFILERVIRGREKIYERIEPDVDFTNALLKTVVEDEHFSRETIIYMLEDFLGGHSAIGNLVMITLAHIAHNNEIGKNIQSEADAVSENGRRLLNLYDMDRMPYTMATISEVLRFSSSPIVPHVATEDTTISDYGVVKGTIVFINNFKLNRSEKYWKCPNLFQPERFLDRSDVDASCTKDAVRILPRRRHSDGADSGVEFEIEDLLIPERKKNGLNTDLADRRNKSEIHLKKNIPHFLPFSIGKRTCIGQSLVRGFGFILLANILQRYDIISSNLANVRTIPACVALPTKTFSLELKNRNL
uniref:Cytochrome P450 n=1 Tax=Musca domestica TaxID=7370 RepID=A0A1I8N7J6_MUSDO